MKSYSQCKQDTFLNNKIFKNKTDGYFVEIGAHDGVSFSNTKMFEEMGWDGICVEPIPDIFLLLKNNRKCKCLEGAISDRDVETVPFLYVEGASNMLSGIADEYDHRHIKRIELESRLYDCHPKEISVPNLRFNGVVEQIEIDLLCIDTEGNELKIIKSIDFNKYNIKVVMIENNYNDDSIPEYMKLLGYSLLERLEGDQIFTKNG